MLLLIRECLPVEVSSAVLFTFHYASTYTLFGMFGWGGYGLFTFHYASTYTQDTEAQPRQETYLHSTMLLLILTTTTHYYQRSFHLHSTMLLLILLYLSHASYFEHIYIPLCFYLYSMPSIAQMTSTLFTFHYASTYTDASAGPAVMLYAFTFHYASTYTRAYFFPVFILFFEHKLSTTFSQANHT